MRIIGFNGSPHSDGATAKLLDEALEGARDQIQSMGHVPEISNINLTDLTLPYHDGTLDVIPPTLADVFRRMRKADGFVFATPVNWFNQSSRMLTFIHWMTCLEHRYELEGKVFGVVVHLNCDGGNQTAMSIVAPLYHMGLMMPPYCAFYRNMNVGERSEEQWQMTDQELVGRNVVRLITRVGRKQRWSL